LDVSSTTFAGILSLTPNLARPSWSTVDEGTAAKAGRLRSVAKAKADMIFDIDVSVVVGLGWPYVDRLQECC
jgi:hypothetical protein